MSAPAEKSWPRPKREFGRLRSTFFVTAYGVTSSRCALEMPAMPSSLPSCEARPLRSGEYSGHESRSTSRSMSRQTPKPKVWLRWLA